MTIKLSPVAVFLLIVGLAALIAVPLSLLLPTSARASGGGGDEDQGLIAVTGNFGNGTAALYLVDSKTRQISVYRMDNDGKSLQFVAARNATYDFFIETYGDRTDSRYAPARLRRDWERFLKRGGQPEDEPEAAEVEPSETEPKGDISLPGGRPTGPDVQPVGAPGSAPGSGGGG